MGELVGVQVPAGELVLLVLRRASPDRVEHAPRGVGEHRAQAPAVGSGSDDFSGAIDQSHNLSSDDTAAGLGSVTGRTPSSQFVSVAAGSEDLHLGPSSDAVNAGTDLSSDFTRDIDGQGRPRDGSWDIGADER